MEGRRESREGWMADGVRGGPEPTPSLSGVAGH